LGWKAPGTIMHGGNLQLILTFDDGVKWLARVQQTIKISPPLAVQRHVKLSEAATFHALMENMVRVVEIEFARPA
jgi:hypothetical protein